VVPAIQLMMRVERDAEMQRRPAWENHSDFAVNELVRPSEQVRRLKHIVSRFAVGSHIVKVQNRGVLQCNCAN
jgi:hypothetical protein